MKTCPFCGGLGRLKREKRMRREDAEAARVLVEWWSVRCERCGARAAYATDQKGALKNWETRTKARGLARALLALNPRLVLAAH